MSCSRDTSTCLRLYRCPTCLSISARHKHKKRALLCAVKPSMSTSQKNLGWSNMWAEFKGGQKAGRVCDEGPDRYGSWELGGGRMTAPSYTPSVGNLRVWVPGEKLCCLVTFCSSGFTSSVRPLRSRRSSEKRRFIPVTLRLPHEIHKSYKRFCSFPCSCIVLSKLKLLLISEEQFLPSPPRLR